jgi:hypothetical protein
MHGVLLQQNLSGDNINFFTAQANQNAWYGLHREPGPRRLHHKPEVSKSQDSSRYPSMIYDSGHNSTRKMMMSSTPRHKRVFAASFTRKSCISHVAKILIPL